MHADASKLPALPHELYVPAVSLTDEKVHVEVAWMKTLHLEVLMPDALVGSVEIDASSHLVDALLCKKEERRLEAVAGPQW